MPQQFPCYLDLLDSGELDQRAEAAVDMLEDCALCGRACHADRYSEADAKGFCHTGQYAYVGNYFAHHGEEQCLRGHGGSGTIFFSNCNLRCAFCQNFELSWQGQGQPVSPDELAAIMLRLQEQQVHNINLVSPSHVVPQILQALAVAAQRGLRLPLVYNTGGYDGPAALRLLDGVVDVYMPDLKFHDPQVAKLLARAEDYFEVACRAIKEMHRQVGDLVLDKYGIARRGLLVRHLVLPEDLAGTRAIMRFLAREISPQTCVNVMSQYRPAGYAARTPAIDRSLTSAEFRAALEIARHEGLQRFA